MSLSGAPWSRVEPTQTLDVPQRGNPSHLSRISGLLTASAPGFGKLNKTFFQHFLSLSVAKIDKLQGRERDAWEETNIGEPGGCVRCQVVAPGVWWRWWWLAGTHYITMRQTALCSDQITSSAPTWLQSITNAVFILTMLPTWQTGELAAARRVWWDKHHRLITASYMGLQVGLCSPWWVFISFNVSAFVKWTGPELLCN